MLRKILLLNLLLILSCISGYTQEKNVNSEITKNKLPAASGKTAEEVAKTALNIGSKMPAFNLKDINGNFVKSQDLLGQGNLVIVFYRGSWCPFCNLYLRKLQQNLEGIKKEKGLLVAISVEDPDNSLTIAKKNELGFIVLSDPNLDTARRFGIVYQLSKETDEVYKTKYNLDIAKHNGMEKPELPLSATYIVNRKGEIVYTYLEPDYTKRAEPQIIIETLSKLK